MLSFVNLRTPLSPVQGLPDSIAVNNVSWKKIYDSLEPDHAPMPEPWRSNLSLLQKIVTLRMLRPDKLIPALTTFVSESLGRRFVEPKPFAIEPSYNDSTCSTPLIFVLSPGRCGTSTTLYSCTCNTLSSCLVVGLFVAHYNTLQCRQSAVYGSSLPCWCAALYIPAIWYRVHHCCAFYVSLGWCWDHSADWLPQWRLSFVCEAPCLAQNLVLPHTALANCCC